MALLIFIGVGLLAYFGILFIYTWITHVPEAPKGLEDIMDGLSKEIDFEKLPKLDRHPRYIILYRNIQEKTEIHRKSRSQKRWKD